MARDDDNTGRNLALAAGGGALLWLFLRRGGRLGLGGTRRPATSSPRRIGIRVDQAGVSVEGVSTDVAGAVVAARAAGEAVVLATGAARQGTVDVLLAALRAAGVTVWMAGGRHGA